LESVRLLELVLKILDLDRGKLEQPSELLDRAVGVDQPVGDDVDPEVGAVSGQGGAVSVERSTLLLSDSSWYFSLSKIASQPSRAASSTPMPA
jgi:hypothetical protein